MQTNGAGFTTEELGGVLRQYNIAKIQQILPISAGNRASPKLILITDKEKYLLKRRPKGKDDALMVGFTHAVQSHLQKKDYPVAGLVPTRGNGPTALILNKRTYELFHFIEGVRCDGSPAEVIEAGRQLAIFHKDLADLESDWKPVRQTYHDSGSVRGHLRLIRSDKQLRPNGALESSHNLQKTADLLLTHYNHSSTTVNAMGFDSWDGQIIHGDWHPGNLLFADHRMICVLDFDSVKTAPPVTDVANGVLQFSIVGVRPNPADWPAYLDQAKMTQFLEGYREAGFLEDVMLRSLPDLMIEIMIAEAVLPIAATGYFGHHSGLEFLQMIHRKCDWIEENRTLLLDAIFH
ncbi:MAG: phosphotransferase [Sedimentisphaerales bacterium]|nr:phosphotransferase [Sedimentisphaerales bacterium]